MQDYKVIKIQKGLCYDLIEQSHYLKRLPSIMFAYGLYNNNELVGACTFGSPPSLNLCEGVCGKEFKSEVLELNRLFLVNNQKNLASFFVSRALKMLPQPSIVVSYADKNNGHCGYVYQATNFIYTGLSEKRTDLKSSSGLHSRTEWRNAKEGETREYVERPRKHRYIYFGGSKAERKLRRQKLNYKIFDYPKTENENYDVDYIPSLQPLLI